MPALLQQRRAAQALVESALVLPLMVTAFNTIEPPPLDSPPPPLVMPGLLPLKVLFVTVALPLKKPAMAPAPIVAELPMKLEPFTIIVPAPPMAPP